MVWGVVSAEAPNSRLCPCQRDVQGIEISTVPHTCFCVFLPNPVDHPPAEWCWWSTASLRDNWSILTDAYSYNWNLSMKTNVIWKTNMWLWIPPASLADCLQCLALWRTCDKTWHREWNAWPMWQSDHKPEIPKQIYFGNATLQYSWIYWNLNITMGHFGNWLILIVL